MTGACITDCPLCGLSITVPAQDKFKDLTTWWKEVLGTSVTGVKVSSRLATSPAIVVTSQYGWSANMERIMKSQVRLPPLLCQLCSWW